MVLKTLNDKWISGEEFDSSAAQNFLFLDWRPRY